MGTLGSLLALAATLVLGRQAWRRWGRSAWARWRTDCELQREADIRAVLVTRWQEKNWWRYPPSEGWHLGYNCNRLPMEYHRHVERHGCIVRPTDEEILKDVGLLAR